tara:strand:- start:684 stop:794 length:111 start_codon:yes stop_codon:yes gene_type:complete
VVEEVVQEDLVKVVVVAVEVDIENLPEQLLVIQLLL